MKQTIKSNQNYKTEAEALWKIIDDIDTLSDIIKPTTEKDYKLFYEIVMKLQEQRHKHLVSDGYTLSPVTQYKNSSINHEKNVFIALKK